MFSVGDGHGAKGDGEVCVTAIETGLVGSFELTVRDDLSLEWPRAETPTHVMTMAFDPDLDDCVVMALRLMVDLVARDAGINRQEAYMLCSLAADLRITQVVNGSKGVARNAGEAVPRASKHSATLLIASGAATSFRLKQLFQVSQVLCDCLCVLCV